MNLVIMTVRHNDQENFINYPEYFRQYCIRILIGDKGNTLHPNTTPVSTSQLYGVSNSHVFTNITMFAYIRPIKCNVQIPNCSKSSEKVFGLFIIKIAKINIIIPIWTSFYMPQNPQNKISQTELKHNNQFRSVINEALRWLQITIDTEMKLEV